MPKYHQLGVKFLLLLVLVGTALGLSPRSLGTIHTAAVASSCSLPRPLGLRGGGAQTMQASSSSCLSLAALPPSTWWVVGHVVGGASPVPFVASATKPGGWYRKISLPSWNPPDKIFGPVWTVLYTCMGLAVSRIWNSSAISATTKKGLMLAWFGHFALNLSWAPTFFGMQRFRAACVTSSLMVMTLLAIIPRFYQVNPTSAYLLIPYLAWITFATFLNRTICARNPTVKGYNDGMLQAQIQTLQADAAKYARL